MKKIIILIAIVIVIAGAGYFYNIQKNSKDILKPEEAKAKIENFINTNFMQSDKKAVVKEITEEDGLYKIVVDIGSGKDIDSYITKDGKKFFPQVMVIEEIEQEIREAKARETSAKTEQIQQASKGYSNQEAGEIKNFVHCLADKKFKIYGANWCGWTKKLTVETFGGFDVVEPIYVECTEEKDLCSREGVQGYPTIKIGAEIYQGQRTFTDFAQATGCEAPNVAEQASAGSASCN